MKRSFLIPVLLMISSTVLCQNKLLLSENFKNNKNGWPVRSDSSFLVAIDNGVLHVEKFKKNFVDRGCLWYKKEIRGLNTSEDFSIIIYAKFLSGGDIMDLLDIQWGTWDKVISSKATNIYQLNFYLKGDVKLDLFNKGWNYSLRTKAREIGNKNLYEPGKFNKYEILQQDGFIILKINDQQYFKQFASPISGNSIGIQGCLKSAWEIDKIIVTQLKRSKDQGADSISASAAVDSVKQAHKNDATTLKVFPNPFINEFTILVSAQKTTTAKIELFDVQGNVIIEYDKKLDPGEQTVRLYADVPPGTYIIRVTIENKVTSTKIVKL